MTTVITMDGIEAPHHGRARHVLALPARLLLLAGLAILAWQAVVAGLAFAGRRGDPAAAVRRAPDNALALAALAQQQLAEDPAKAALTARKALRRSPANAAAAGALGMALTQTGDQARSLGMLGYAQAMSRRDLPTQLWAIEVAVQRGDIPEALHHYDIALRVNRTAPPLLFPVLLTATETPAVRTSLARLLAQGTPWKDSFLDFLAARSGDVMAASRLISEIYAAGGKTTPGPVSILTQRLIEANQSGPAWSLYARRDPRGARQLLRNGRFDRAVDLPTPFDWQLSDSGEARAVILPDPRGGVLQVDARDGSGGVVARQRLVLAQGTYLLRFNASAADGATLGDSRFDVLCLPARNRIAQAPLAAGSGRTDQRWRFTVPAGCANQSLELTLVPGRTEAAIEAALSEINVTRVPSSSNGSLQ
jgi:tetratricopeptide (TPR) repeat protein